MSFIGKIINEYYYYYYYIVIIIIIIIIRPNYPTVPFRATHPTFSPPLLLPIFTVPSAKFWIIIWAAEVFWMNKKTIIDDWCFGMVRRTMQTSEDVFHFGLFWLRQITPSLVCVILHITFSITHLLRSMFWYQCTPTDRYIYDLLLPHWVSLYCQLKILRNCTINIKIEQDKVDIQCYSRLIKENGLCNLRNNLIKNIPII